MTDYQPILNPMNRVSGKSEMFVPFGPLIAYQCLSENTVSELNRICDEHTKGRHKLNDHSTDLVGKVREELTMTQEGAGLVMNEIWGLIENYLSASKFRFSLNPNETGVKLQSPPAINGWYVRQFSGDYNPIHTHTQCDLSCIGYLKIPKKLEQEWDAEEKKYGLNPNTNKSISHGLTQFISDTGQKDFEQHTFCLKPKAGDFWLFPSHLQHIVWPFKSKGERRSFSMNITLDPRKMSNNQYEEVLVQRKNNE